MITEPSTTPARDGGSFLRRVALFIALIAVLGVYFSPPLAWAAVMVLTVTLCGLIVARVHQWNGIPRATIDEDAADPHLREFEVGLRTGLVIGVSLFSVAITLSAALLGWEFTLTSGAVIFCALIIFGGPIWLAGIGSEEESAHVMQTGEHRANQ